MRKIFKTLLYILLTNGSYAQVSDDFSDGNFDNDPVWVENTSDFKINPSLQLQSNNIIANSSYYLTTASPLATSAQWEFFVQINFNPSSQNYIDAYLTSSSNNLLALSNQGYYVRVGNTDDEICLYRKDSNGLITKIIDGETGILNHSNNILKIKVIRNQSNQWTLFRDQSGTGNNYISEGSFIDSTYTTSAFFGFLIKQSTESFFQKHFIDDIEVTNYLPDVTPPVVLSAITISNTQVDVLFNEALDKTTGELFSNYWANNGIGMPVTVNLDAATPALVHLTFENSFNNGMAYTLSINDVLDNSGNVINNGSVNFSFYIPQQFDVVIDELFPDPNPHVGLPLLKFLELKNVSPYLVNLQNWKLIDGSSVTSLSFCNLKPDSFVIVCSANSAASYMQYGPALGVGSFPSLNIGGATIILKSSTNKTIHSVNYDLSTYKNELKKDGGWTLEMIDTKNPCAGSSNWKASNDATGGTPGRKNSVDGVNKDENPPRLMRAFCINDSTLSLVFDEPVDSLKSAGIGNYKIDKNFKLKSVIAISPFFNEVHISLSDPVITGIIYTVSALNISDCAENIIGTRNTARFGIAQDADSLDLVVNEILFNPLPMGADYVELYNRSKKIIDLKKVFIANRNSSNVISNIKQVSEENYLLFPEEFVLVTTDADAVKSQYITPNPDALLNMKSFPSFPNTGGNVIVLNNQGNILDEIPYFEKWHFPLIKNPQGVSLERIEYDGPSVQINFHSAATSAGYGTPGYKNSQSKLKEELHGEINITPEIFSPDDDGIDDFVTINYNFPSPGYVANITVFDASGRPVRYLQKNSLNGINGYFRWDGLDDKSRKLPQGIYIIYTEIFNSGGKKKSFKNTVVLARKNN
jgi:hypothetical protein